MFFKKKTLNPYIFFFFLCVFEVTSNDYLSSWGSSPRIFLILFIVIVYEPISHDEFKCIMKYCSMGRPLKKIPPSRRKVSYDFRGNIFFGVNENFLIHFYDRSRSGSDVKDTSSKPVIPPLLLIALGVTLMRLITQRIFQKLLVLKNLLIPM